MMLRETVVRGAYYALYRHEKQAKIHVDVFLYTRLLRGNRLRLNLVGQNTLQLLMCIVQARAQGALRYVEHFCNFRVG